MQATFTKLHAAYWLKVYAKRKLHAQTKQRDCMQNITINTN